MSECEMNSVSSWSSSTNDCEAANFDFDNNTININNSSGNTKNCQNVTFRSLNNQLHDLFPTTTTTSQSSSQSSSTKPQFSSDFSKILNPCSPSSSLSSPCQNQTPVSLAANSLHSSAIRRQSLSARYLMKHQHQQQNQQQQQQHQNTSETPVSMTTVSIADRVLERAGERNQVECLETRRKVKSVCTHTESSLNKTRSKSWVKRSPSVNSLSNESRSSSNVVVNNMASSQKAKCNSAKSSPKRMHDDTNANNNLKKALSMVSLGAKQNLNKK
ncbi:hypothetical protein BpHYR1_019167, partial [Brachionus plicatilis]